MTCPSCGADNKPGRKFCVRCATPLALACPTCGTAYDPGDAFCGECAAPLADAATPRGGAPAPTSTPAQVAERRLVSVLFADLVGFTPFAEERDSEDVRETLSRYFELATEIVGRYGGAVEKFIGDAVMAVWGAPVAHEDDAERAVRAALELVSAVRVLGAGIDARAGVLTGEAAVTIGATNQGMVAGDLVNTAARLQSAAAPGTVLVGEATHRAASSAIAFEPAGEQSLKGKAAPVLAFRALRVVAERGGRGRSDTLEAPFVGRDDELQLVKDLFHATVREGRARLVSITGTGGIGKSRLAWEFEKYLDGIVGTVWWHRGRSPAYGEGVTFWALSEMIRERAGLGETDDERTTRTNIGSLLDTVKLNESERRWIEPALLALLGLDAGSIGPEQLFGAWRTLFERLSATGPVVLLFEDLQWADTGTLDFVDHLLEWSRSTPIFVLTLARPELLDRRSDWEAGRRNFTSIHLDPLARPQMRSLLDGLVPGMPDAAAAAVVDRAEGIPLYAVEMVRMLITDGHLAARGDGTYAPDSDLASFAVPETLTALIAARLDALDPAARVLVMDAAVLGQSFAPTALAAVCGIDEGALEPRLRALVRREVFAHETDPRSPERGQYAFVQALIREVAYNTLARRDRKVRHLAAARYFESLGTDEIAAILAGHFLAARDNAAEPAEADALGVQARIALRAAAERATALGSNDQALVFLEQALGMTADPIERAELLERAGNAASAGSRSEVGERYLREAIAERRVLGDRMAIARTTAALGRSMITHRTVEAIALLESTLVEFEDLAADPAVIDVGGQLSRAYFLADDNRRAIEVADRVLEAAEHVDAVGVVADVLITKGTALAILGRTTEGMALITAGQQVAEANDLGPTRVRAATNLALILGVRDPRAAHDVARAGMAFAARLGLKGSAVLLLCHAVEASVRMGDWSRAIDEVDAMLVEGLEPADRIVLLSLAVYLRALTGGPADDLVAEMRAMIEATDEPTFLATWHLAEGDVAFAAGRLGPAREAWRRSVAFATDYLPTVIALSARAALWEGDVDAARDDLATLDASGVHGPAVEASRVTIGAGLDALEGRATAAWARYREARQAWRDLGLAWDEAMCGLDMVSVLDPADPDVREVAASTREILVRLGAAPFIARLDAAMAATSAGAGAG